MIDWYKKVVFENYANFNGRARRSEYWWFALANFIIAIIAMVLDNVLHINFSDEVRYGPIYVIFALATFIPGLAVAVRRLHDVGKSGWFYFIVLIPLVGAIWLLVLFFTEGERMTNQYGPDPKGNDSEIDQIGKTV